MNAQRWRWSTRGMKKTNALGYVAYADYAKVCKAFENMRRIFHANPGTAFRTPPPVVMGHTDARAAFEASKALGTSVGENIRFAMQEYIFALIEADKYKVRKPGDIPGKVVEKANQTGDHLQKLINYTLAMRDV